MHLLSSHSESRVTAYLSKDPCHRCSGSALTSHKEHSSCRRSLNYFMFLPFFPHNQIFTVLSRLRYTPNEQNSFFTLWRPEPDSFGLSESRMAARVDLHVSGKKIFFFFLHWIIYLILHDTVRLNTMQLLKLPSVSKK